jgi:cytochrome c oxidase cbb3-type subunit 3
MSAFWHWFIVVITIASILGSLWLLLGNSRRKDGDSADTGHVWDGDLKELNNPLPRWWFNLFVITVVFGVGYLVIYPGLGGFTGTAGWTQEKEMQTRLDALLAHRNAIYAQLRGQDIPTLATNASAQSIGRDVYLKNCAGCHGADAQGAIGFPNLADQDWLYGGSPEAIVASIRDGRRGQMPGFLGSMTTQQADDLERLVQHWSDPGLDKQVRERGLQRFAVTCAACHGAEGKGNPLLGAPNLTDDIWLHGGSRKRIHETIVFGRASNMPAHASVLSEDDLRLVAAYVFGLSAKNEHARASNP